MFNAVSQPAGHERAGQARRGFYGGRGADVPRGYTGLPPHDRGRGVGAQERDHLRDPLAVGRACVARTPASRRGWRACRSSSARSRWQRTVGRPSSATAFANAITAAFGRVARRRPANGFERGRRADAHDRAAGRFRRGSAACVTRYVGRRLSVNMRSKSASGVSSTGWSAANPPTRFTTALQVGRRAHGAGDVVGIGEIGDDRADVVDGIEIRSGLDRDDHVPASSTSAATTERPRPPAPPVTSTVRAGIALRLFRPTRDLGFARSVRVRDLTPGQEIDQVLMVRASDARHVVLGDRTGTLEAAPCQFAAGSCVRVVGTRGTARSAGRALGARRQARRVRPGRPARRPTNSAWTGWRPTCAR